MGRPVGPPVAPFLLVVATTLFGTPGARFAHEDHAQFDHTHVDDEAALVFSGVRI